MTRQYILAIVYTDTGRDEYGESWDGSLKEIAGRARELLDRHGHVAGICNAQMIQEADTAGHFLAQWEGFRLGAPDLVMCGYLIRYDLFAVPAELGGLPGRYLWEKLQERRREADRAREAAGWRQDARAELARVGVPAGDPDYDGILDWVASSRLSGDRRHMADRLAAFRGLAARAGVAAACPAYQGREWLWALGTAKTGDPYERVERELAAELAELAARAEGA
jgi:hypothetical protein